MIKPVLNNNWKKGKIGNLAKVKNGFAFKSGDYGTDGIPVIRISDIQDGIVTPERTKLSKKLKAFCLMQIRWKKA